MKLRSKTLAIGLTAAVAVLRHPEGGERSLSLHRVPGDIASPVKSGHMSASLEAK